MLYGGVTNQVFPRVYTDAELAAIEIPALLLVGDHEKIYNGRKVIAIVEKAAPGLQGEVVPGAYHITALSQPEWVNARLLRFFIEVEKSSR